MAKGELRRTDPGLVAHIVMGSVMDLILRRQILYGPLTTQYSREQIIDSLVSLVLKGLQP